MWCWSDCCYKDRATTDENHFRYVTETLETRNKREFASDLD